MLTHRVSKRSFLLTLGIRRLPPRVAGVLRPAGRRVMLCLVLMAVELVIVSTRVQSANYTAYKPSTGRPRAAAPGKVGGAHALAPSGVRAPFPLWRRPTVPGREDQVAGSRTPRVPSPGPRDALAPARAPAYTWRGRASGQRSERTCTCGPRPTPPNPRWLHPSLCRGPAPVPRASRGPPPQVPFLLCTLSGAGSHLPHSRVRCSPENVSSGPSPNPRAGSLNPVRPAAPNGRVTVAVAGQPPLEPRGGGGGARARWGWVGGGAEAARRGRGRVLVGKKPWRPRHRFLRSFSS